MDIELVEGKTKTLWLTAIDNINIGGMSVPCDPNTLFQMVIKSKSKVSEAIIIIK